jgi:hypothetical protein
MLDHEQLLSLYRRFDHTHRLDVSEMGLFVGRDDGAADTIARELRLGLEPDGKWVMCGSIGCGKSSELVHLAVDLGADYAVVGIDLLESVPNVDDLEPAEVLFLIGAGIIRAANDYWNLGIDKTKVAALEAAFKGLIPRERQVDLSAVFKGVALFTAGAILPGLKDALMGASDIAAGVAGGRRALSSGTPLGGLTRPLREGEPDLSRLASAVEALLDEVRKHRPPVILIDGLDKLTALPAIRRLFIHSDILAAARVPIVYTGPVTLMVSTVMKQARRAFSPRRLCNLVVRSPSVEWAHPSDEQITAGRATLHRIVERRVSEQGLDLADAFAPDVIDALITRSGGVVRDLILLVNRAIRWAIFNQRGRVDADAVEAAIIELRKELEITLTTARVEALRHIRSEGEPDGTDEGLDLLLQNYALPYSNGRAWFEPHPLLDGLRTGL